MIIDFIYDEIDSQHFKVANNTFQIQHIRITQDKSCSFT